jgi:hypothetical protein
MIRKVVNSKSNLKNGISIRALRSVIIVSLKSFNRLIASIFAYYNCENNCYNRFVKAYRKATVIVIKSIKINDYNKRVLIASFVNSKTND